MMISRRVACATIFSRKSAPPPPLIRFRFGSTSSAPSMVTSRFRGHGVVHQGDAGALCQLPCGPGGREGDDVLQCALRKKLSDAESGEVGSRSGAESDLHPGQDEAHGIAAACCFSRVRSSLSKVDGMRDVRYVYRDVYIRLAVCRLGITRRCRVEKRRYRFGGQFERSQVGGSEVRTSYGRIASLAGNLNHADGFAVARDDRGGHQFLNYLIGESACDPPSFTTSKMLACLRP